MVNRVNHSAALATFFWRELDVDSMDKRINLGAARR